ncbi:MAG: family 20 glycosylhydrolase, partial [Bacteroidales bacterium]|nr:family 20 glycosylhydrolase [Bacteroidales bacterium]
YRGLLLDVARCFLPKDYVLQVIDCMGMLKLNKLHWHLTDDNGWRVEIKRYPLLTDVGAWRVDRGDIPFPARRNPSADEETPVGGYYTQDEIREIVSYAAERNVEVIPEIDIPAHSNAALAAYPQYACPVVKDFIGVLPGIGGRNADIIYCAGNDSVYVFLQNVLDEVMDLFPSRYIHIGGDEAGKSNWEKCPLCQKRIKEEHLGDEEDLQGYFMGRIASYVRSKGREVIGWDELTNSTIPDDAIVIGWQENGSAALKAAAQGHRFVMAPAKQMYIIRYQGPQWFEPLTYFGNITLKDLYDYEPVRPNWSARYSDLLMGVECCMWTEFCYSPEDVSYLLFPRLAALAEIAWTPRGSKNWPDFLRRADAFLPRLEAKGIGYARSMYNIQHTVIPAGHGRSLSVTLDCIRPDVEIRYTLDGTDPTDSSALYTAPIIVDSTLTLTCATFRGGERLGRTLSLPLRFNKATGAKIRAKGDAGMLVNGLRGSLKQTDFEWRTWTPGQQMSFTVDLGQADTLSRVAVGTITNYGMAVHKPSSMTLEVSEGGLRYTIAGRKDFTPQEIFREGTYIEDIVFDLDSIPARYLRVSFKDAGSCPKNHVRPGMASKVYIDEIIAE